MENPGHFSAEINTQARGGVRARLSGRAAHRVLLIFALNALGGIVGIWPLFGASFLQTLVRYMEIVALYSLFMAVTSSDQPGTDFTILSCAQLIVYLVGSMIAGRLADMLGYGALFSLSVILSGVAVVATVMLLNKTPQTPA